MTRLVAVLLTVAGLAWAALAIWNRAPRTSTHPERYYGGRPAYPDSTDGGIHHSTCRWPLRPCLCDLMPGDPGPRSFA